MPYVHAGPAILADGDTAPIDTAIPILAQLGLDEQNTRGGVLTTNTVIPELTARRPRLRQDIHWPRPDR